MLSANLLALLQIALLSAAAIPLVRRGKLKPLLPLGVAAVLLFSGWWFWDGRYTEGPRWLLVVVTGIYASATLFTAVVASGTRRWPVHFITTVLGGSVGYVLSGLIGMEVWIIVDWIT